MTDEKQPHGTHPVKHRVLRALQQSTDHVRAVEEGVSEAIDLAKRDADRALHEAAVPMRDIIQSAMDGAVEAGADLAQVAQGILAGILRDGRECGLATQEAFEEAARTILQHAERIGADVTAAARGILQGAIRNAKRFGRAKTARKRSAS